MEFDPHLDDSNPPKIPLPEFALPLCCMLSRWRGWRSCRLGTGRAEVSVASFGFERKSIGCGARLGCLSGRLLSRTLGFVTIDPRRQPRYSPRQWLAILVLKSARGWNTAQAAKRFHVTTQTIRNWMRVGTSLVELPEKVTRYPDYLRFIVQQHKAVCPILGGEKLPTCLPELACISRRARFGESSTNRPSIPRRLSLRANQVMIQPKSLSKKLQGNLAGDCESRLVGRFDIGAHRPGLLGALVTEFIAARTSVLLASFECRRPFFSSSGWLQDLP